MCKRFSSHQLCTHPPVPPKDARVSTCPSQPREGWRGGWGAWPPTEEPEIRRQRWGRGQVEFKKLHPGLEWEGRWEGK